MARPTGGFTWVSRWNRNTGCRNMFGSIFVHWAFTFPWRRWRDISACGMSGCRPPGLSMITATRMDSGGCTRFIDGQSGRLCACARSGDLFFSTTRRRWFASRRNARIGSEISSTTLGSCRRRRIRSFGRLAWVRERGRCGSMLTLGRFALGITMREWSFRSRGMRRG
jgi:hypothetical protein